MTPRTRARFMVGLWSLFALGVGLDVAGIVLHETHVLTLFSLAVVVVTVTTAGYVVYQDVRRR